ncbi:MAG TPA: nuclear transport factor 2 family protein [Woeseiaceae bacterium]|nr:nuclear transport factor 2 family protein [Woeseiaceae bacterium]
MNLLSHTLPLHNLATFTRLTVRKCEVGGAAARALRWVTVVTLMFAPPGMTAADQQMRSGELPPGLAEAMHAYDQATFQNDIETYRGLVADEYLLVNSDASLEDKEQSILPFDQPGFRIDPHVTEQPLQIIWSDGAVLGGLLRLSWTQDGKRHTRLVRRAHVWARRDGRWRLMYTQVTRVPE